jgi:Chaperone of endosialidase
MAASDDNTAIGNAALYANLGAGNTAIGAAALQNLTTGNFNTAVGMHALQNATGNTNGNVAIGFSAGVNATTGSNNIYIGSTVSGSAGDDSVCYIDSIFGQTSGGTAVLITSNGKLGTITSSRRFKDDIKPMNDASDVILGLKPVTFHYKKAIDPKAIRQFGLVAEDVEAVNPDLVVRDKQGKPYSVRYDQVNAMLLNEFLKEHRTVQEQQKEIDALKTELKEQRAFIQKVNDKVELAKPAPQTVLNNQ